MNDHDRKLMDLAFEQAAQRLAELALSIADDTEHMPDIGGPAALRAFAQAILDANRETWPTDGMPS